MSVLKGSMQEDTDAGVIQGWLDEYEGEYVCSHMLYHEALEHLDNPKKWEMNEICEIMNTVIFGWVEGPVHRFTKEGYGIQRFWMRKNRTVNEPVQEEFRPLTEAEKQIEIPSIDLPK